MKQQKFPKCEAIGAIKQYRVSVWLIEGYYFDEEQMGVIEQALSKAFLDGERKNVSAYADELDKAQERASKAEKKLAQLEKEKQEALVSLKQLDGKIDIAIEKFQARGEETERLTEQLKTAKQDGAKAERERIRKRIAEVWGMCNATHANNCFRCWLKAELMK
jgi:DNA repair exonuclease SbcCD ATPase subunit